MKRVSLIAAALFACIITAGVAAQEPAYPPPACASCGVVTSVRYVEPKGDGSGAGAIVGGVVGGVLGHRRARNSTGSTFSATA